MSEHETTEEQKRERIAEKIRRYRELAAVVKVDDLRLPPDGDDAARLWEFIGLSIELFPIVLRRAEALETYISVFRESVFWNGHDPEDAEPDDVHHVEECWADALDALGRHQAAAETRTDAAKKLADRKAEEAAKERAREARRERKYNDVAMIVSHMTDDDVIAAASKLHHKQDAPPATREEAIRALMWEPIVVMIYQFNPPTTPEIVRLRLGLEPWEEYAAKHNGKGRTAKMTCEALAALFNGYDVGIVYGTAAAKEELISVQQTAWTICWIEAHNVTGLLPQEVWAYREAHPEARIFWDHTAEAYGCPCGEPAFEPASSPLCGACLDKAEAAPG